MNCFMKIPTLPLLLFAFATVAIADPVPEYKSKYRVINVHLHCGAPRQDVLRAEFEVDDRVGVASVVILDAGSPAGSLPAWLEMKKKFPDRLIVFYKLNFRPQDLEKSTFFSDIVRELQ